MKHLLMIVANHNFQDFEFNNPYQLFLEKGYAVDICSGKGGVCI
jgi:putative intracellular protease/amidase